MAALTGSGCTSSECCLQKASEFSILRFLTALEKNELNISAIAFVSDIISSPSVSNMSPEVTVLSEKSGFTVFQNFLLFAILDGSKFPK